MTSRELLIRDSNILEGKLHIKNTDILVDTILEKLSNGNGIKDILLSYPQLTQDHIVACIAYQVTNNSFFEMRF